MTVGVAVTVEVVTVQLVSPMLIHVPSSVSMFTHTVYVPADNEEIVVEAGSEDLSLQSRSFPLWLPEEFCTHAVY